MCQELLFYIIRVNLLCLFVGAANDVVPTHLKAYVTRPLSELRSDGWCFT